MYDVSNFRVLVYARTISFLLKHNIPINMHDKKFKVVGLGEVLWDIYQDQRHLGGAPANFAIHVNQLGDEGLLVSRVGDDGMGKGLLHALRDRKLATDCVQLDRKKGTGTVMISLDIKGVPTFQCSQDVAFDYLKFTPALEKVARSCDAVMFGTLAQRSNVARENILQFLRAAHDAVKIFDVNTRASEATLLKILPPSLELADILKMNDGETEILRRVLRRDGDSTERFVQYLLHEYDFSLIAITYGDNGCGLFNREESCRVPGLPIKVVDTTGAGDAFSAGLMHKYLRQAPLPEIAAFANTTGAFVCTKSGATPAFTMQELLQWQRSLSLPPREQDA